MTWTLRMTRISMRSSDDNGRPIPALIDIGGTQLLVEVTARGYQRLTGRRHQRVRDMHTAYSRRRKRRKH